MTLWLAIPVMVFSFNHSPIISLSPLRSVKSTAIWQNRNARRSAFAHIMMVLTVMFFVFSCVLSLTPADRLRLKEQNISILSYR